jgi:hypothetical protein
MRLEGIAWTLIGAALLVGAATRFLPLVHYVNFLGDQTRDAYAYAAMHQGQWPAMGPDLPLNRLKLPPLYYYLVFPFTVLGPDPTWQALPNAMFSFLMIPLLIYALHMLLDGAPRPLRLLLSAVGGLWWSVLAVDITLGIREWNPSPISFFSLAFVTIAAAQIRRPAWGGKALLAWSALGVLLALLVSLHSTTLYVVPIVFAMLAAAFIVRASSRARASGLVALALGVAVVCLMPYWQNEMSNDWHNTRGLFALSHDRAAIGTIPDKIQNGLLAYTWLSGQAYFLGESEILHRAGILFLVLIPLIMVSDFRGNRVLLSCLACLWIAFLCAASEYAATEIRYRSLIVEAPIFLALASLAFLNYSSFLGRVCCCLLSLGVAVSIASNAAMVLQQQAYYFGPSRLLAVSDIVTAFRQIPQGSSICSVYWPEQYIDQYVTRKDLHLAYCVRGVYEIIPKHFGDGVNGSDFRINYDDYRLAYLQSARLLQAAPPPPDSRIIFQNEAFSLVLLGEGR